MSWKPFSGRSAVAGTNDHTYMSEKLVAVVKQNLAQLQGTAVEIGND